MDTQLISRGSKLAQMRKKWFFILAAVGFSGYGAYKVYNLLPSVDSKRRRLIKLISALSSVLDALAESAEAAGVVAKDLKDFLGTQSDEIPCSLRQVSKIAMSDEFVDSVSRITQAVTAGTLKSYGGDSDVEGRVGDGMDSGFNDRFFDKLFSDSGSGFASVVVGNFARNVVMAMYAGMKTNRELIDSSDDPGSYVSDEDGHGHVPKWVDLMCSDRSRALVGGCIQVFVSTAVTVYLEKTMHINPYNDFFAGATNPNHEEKVKDIVVSVCDRAVETMIKTSHKVLTNPETRDSAHPPSLLSGEENSDPHVDQGQSSLEVEQNGYQHMPLLDAPGWKDDAHKPSGWLSEVSSTLLVPRNRSFILDVTGRVTFETVRSFLEFLLQTLLNGIKSCYKLVHDIVANTWVEVTSYVSVNSLAVMTIFLSLFVYIFLGAWLLMLA